MRTWLYRIGGGMVALLLVLAALGSISYSNWKTEKIRELETGSTVIDTKKGAIEYAIAGSGVPFLELHGNPGGYDQMLVPRKIYPSSYENRMTISVSRPGYLRTPLASGKTFEEHADLFAAFLDEIGIEKVFVFGASGGGYSALQFAIRHPERCLGLILLAPSVNYEPLPEGGYEEAGRRIPVPNLLSWALDGPLTNLVVKYFIPDLDENDQSQLAMTREIIQSDLFPFESRLDGIRNEILQRDFPEIDNWPLEKITVPTLLLHGDRDENSVFEGSVYVASKVKNAKLVRFAGGDHNMIITRFPEIQGHIKRFTNEVMDGRWQRLASAGEGRISLR